MDRNLSKLGFIGLGIAALGVFLSFFLILEYYGTAGEVGQGLCGIVGEPGSCKQVAESKYSALRSLPILGDVPVALLGFAYYGSLAFGFFKLGTAKSTEEVSSVVSLLFPFILLGIGIDIILFLISTLAIGTVCSMCLMTYAVTIALLALILFIKKQIDTSGESNFVISLKKNFMNYAIAFLAFFSLGLVAGKASANDSGKVGSVSESSSYGSKIAKFESGKNLGLVTEGSAMVGDKSAPITIVKFADFNCGHCMHASHILNQMLVEYDGMIKVVYMNFPLDSNCNRLVGRAAPGASSCVAATASLCGEKQGKFREVYNGLYSDTENGVMHTAATVSNVASKSGLDMNKFRSCMSSQSVQQQLQKEIDQAEKVNIQSTPSIFINDKAIEAGTPDVNFLKALLSHLVKKA
ncbi:vitamin K epoxide reductase/DsbA family protein [Leptospira sp. GIMC2001]|uniref:vitamin K epoxide reductase/DsbA family protein n=1 Tax=Leptospira sp. GIMC2001 TaxID=1513297 RepID=UPI00234AC386|nr:thioredoxin domain-containing protein [Leptospira sp. GIMC2001]WCL48619.1 thioredoxin domain-containing protein [Leptospira sp. GIMC2001]